MAQLFQQMKCDLHSVVETNVTATGQSFVVHKALKLWEKSLLLELLPHKLLRNEKGQGLFKSSLESAGLDRNVYKFTTNVSL